MNPFGKVPVLVDGDVVIYELGAICAYLADKFSDKGLASIRSHSTPNSTKSQSITTPRDSLLV
jgi:glutathione S-transferase